MPLCHPVHRLSCFLLLSGSLLLGGLLAGSAAQVSTVIRSDNTLGTAVTKTGNVYDITGGTRPGNGPNLFHSFEHFSVGTEDTASFSGPAGIANILSRVTGGQQSLIDGRLQSTIAGANLYLLNPSGVLFGPNASLNISGSFHVSTADYLRLADGATFSAHLGEKSTFTVAPPAAFGFLGTTPAPITIQGSALQVAEGKALSVVGGDVQIVGGQLVAPGGRIQVASVASPGEALFSPLELTPDLQIDSFARLGSLEISQGAFFDVGGNAAGTVLIRGGRLTVANASIAAITGDGDGAKMGVDLRITENVVVDNRLINVPFITAGSMGDGNVGEIRVEAGNLMLTGGAVIGSLAIGSGKGGNITVSARESVSISGRNDQGTASGIATFAAADPGRLSLSAPSVTIDGGVVGTPSAAVGGFVGGRGGDTVVKADNLTLSGVGGIFSGTTTGSSGGSITIEVGRLTVSGGAQISSGTFGPGQGGTVQVTATDTLTLTGNSPDGGVVSGITANAVAREAGAGAAGSVVVQAPRVTLTGGAQIGSGTFGPGHGGTVQVTATESLTFTGTSPDGRFSSGISANAEGREAGAGAAGSVVVQAPRVTLTRGAQIDSGTFGPGHGGTVQVTATESLTFTGASPDGRVASGIFASTEGTGMAAGAAGSIVVQAPRVALTGGAVISSGTFGPGQGGPVQVTATESLTLAGTSPDGRIASGIFASTEGTGMGAGNAGTIVVEAPTVTLTEGALISTSSSGPGRGGDLRVVATETISLTGRGSLRPQTGLFSVADGSGDAGRLFVSAPRLDVVGGRINARTLGGGHAGDLEVRVGRLTLTEGGQIFNGTGTLVREGEAIGIDGPGRGGSLTVLATDSIFIAGRDPEGFRSGVFSSAQFGRGEGGNLFISTPTLEVRDGAGIVVDSLRTSSGSAGNIEVRVGRLTSTSGAQISSRTAGVGRGGNVTVVATEQLELSDGGTISASSAGQGDAGNIVLQAGRLFRGRNGIVTTEAETADGGNITLTVGSRVELRDSQITATVKGGEGQGGNILIDPQFVVLQRSQVRADAFGGPGGKVSVMADVFLADPASQVSASSALNLPGTVDIQAAVTNLSELVAPLTPDFARATELLRDRCAARLREGTVSSFVARGRASLPATYDGLLPSRLYEPQQYSPPAGASQPPHETTVFPQRQLRVDRAWRVQTPGGATLSIPPLVLALSCAR